MALLETGIHPATGSGADTVARFIEVFPYDVLAHEGDIAEAHKELTTDLPIPMPKCAAGAKCPLPQ